MSTQNPMKVCHMFLKSKFKTHRVVIPDFSQINKIKKKREREHGRGKKNNIFPCRCSGENSRLNPTDSLQKARLRREVK